jgi:hypothetical protein
MVSHYCSPVLPARVYPITALVHQELLVVDIAVSAQGRVKVTLQQISKHEDRIENTYNEQGDVASETKRTVRTDGASDNLSSANSDVRYSYHYDTHDNWTRENYLGFFRC